MSKFYDIADAIAAHLVTVPGLESVPIVVDRQKDIVSELRKVIGKSSGCLVVVSWLGAPNKDVSADGPRLVSLYAVTVFAKPIIRSGETAADDIVESIAVALHDHRLTAADHYSERLVVTGIDPVQAPDLLVYQIKVSTPSQF